MLLNELLIKPKKKKKKIKILKEKLEKAIPDLSASSRPQSRDWDRGMPRYKKSAKLEPLGIGGATSVAHKHKPSGDVVKYTELGREGISHTNYQFLRLILKHQDNPYFPKVYKVKTYPKRGVSDTAEMVLRMEELHHLDNSNFYKIFDELGLERPTNKTAWQAGLIIDGLFMKPQTRQQLMRTTKNPKLREALRLLEPLFRHYQPDMHIANWMLRTNGELVITDPII